MLFIFFCCYVKFNEAFAGNRFCKIFIFCRSFFRSCWGIKLSSFTYLQAAVTTNHPLYFQFKFARLRCDMLNAYSQLLTSCSLVKLCPPAKMIEVVNDAQCYSRITNQVELNSVDNLTLIEVSR